MTWLVVKNKGVFINLEKLSHIEWNPEEGTITFPGIGTLWVPKEKTMELGYRIAHEMGRGGRWKRFKERLFGPGVIEIEALRWESTADREGC